MSLILYYGSGSPFAWRVQLALGHKAIAYEAKLLSFSAGDLRQPSFRALNPRGEVPLLLDDGFPLAESAAILEYLDERFPDSPKLFPGDLRERALARRLVREVDCHLARAEVMLTEELFFESNPAERDAARIAEGRALMARELAYFDGLLSAKVFGERFTAADFTLYPFVAMVARYELRQPELALSSEFGLALRAWMTRIEALPYFAQTYPPHWRA
ncbi:MAG TPA: glutathione S-transferase family protein [Polyangiaceae bacterium]|jgi:glutathione S-transferase|nr:glutathione S-transferase family protein [Polyangiaceae bacterium]